MAKTNLLAVILATTFAVGCPASDQTESPLPQETPPPVGQSESQPQPSSQPFDDFTAEHTLLEDLVDCDDPNLQRGGGGLGPLFSCVKGQAQTVKLFVNGDPDSRRVANVKVMWNDWEQDTGFGLHADRTEAHKLVQAVAHHYFAAQAEEITASFIGSTDAAFANGRYRASVTHTEGPAIREHLLMIEALRQVAAAEIDRAPSAGYFERCKRIIADELDLNYPLSALQGDGAPIKEGNVTSFLIVGEDRDQFFCEIHPGNEYRIKAAFRAKYPFRYVASGDL